MHRSNDNRSRSGLAVHGWAVVLVFVSTAVAFAGPPATDHAAAAKVNGVVIPKRSVSDVVDALTAQDGAPPDATAAASLRKRALDSLIEFELLYQESEKRHLTVSAAAIAASIRETEAHFNSPKDYEAALTARKMTRADVERETRKMLAVNRLLDEVVWKDVTVEDDAIRTFYEENREQFRHPEQIRASQIVVRVPAAAASQTWAQARAKAEKLLQRVRGGEDFAEVARRESGDATSAARGGDLGYLSRGMMGKAFEETAFRLHPGQMSGVVESPFGYEIIKVMGAREAGVAPLPEVRDRIVAVLMDEARRQRQDAFVADLRRKASIEIAPGSP